MAYVFLDVNEFSGSTRTKWAKAAKFLREKYSEHQIGKACYGWQQDRHHFIGVDTSWWRSNPTNYSEEDVQRILARYPETAERIYYNCNNILLGEIDYGEPIESTSAL
jgi:hypothetical protein